MAKFKYCIDGSELVIKDLPTLAGTQAAGTLDTLKVIVNPGAIYAIQYDTDSPITWGTVTDTTIPYTCTSGVGVAGFGGGWAYSTDTGEFDYVVSSAVVTTTCTLTTVTGTNTASNTGVLISQAGTGLSQVVPLTADALRIEAGEIDIDGLTAGTDSLALTILENRVESVFQGSEIMRPKKTAGSGGLENQAVRTLGTKDFTKIFAYAKIEGNVWNK